MNGPPRLGLASLPTARPPVRLPAYDPARLGVGVVHLGLGAFVRAHQALYTDDLLAEEPGDWGIVGVSLRHPDQRDRLLPQDGLYTALCRGPTGPTARVVGCVRAALVAPEDPEAVVAAMADPAIRIVSLTVTEKGYGLDPVTGRLQADHPDVRHDLRDPERPRTALGLLAAALARRRKDGLAPFTVLCCDNLAGNGELLARLVGDFAAAVDDRLAGWIEANGAFPSTMVDRIVPATTPEDLAEVARLTGLADAAPVVHEPFRQWVIEDRFVEGGRPCWDRVGAVFVGDVAPFERAKLRLLNAAHSALAYLGYLAGHGTIAEAANDPVLRRFIELLWRAEIVPVLTAPPGMDLTRYTELLLERFANPAIRHRTRQIAMDGSQKLPPRLLATVRERLARDLPLPGLALVVAAWLRYVGGVDQANRPIEVQDPLAAELRALLDRAGPEPGARVDAALGVEAIFGADLGRERRFAEAVARAYRTLLERGTRAAVAELLARTDR